MRTCLRTQGAKVPSQKLTRARAHTHTHTHTHTQKTPTPTHAHTHVRACATGGALTFRSALAMRSSAASTFFCSGPICACSATSCAVRLPTSPRSCPTSAPRAASSCSCRTHTHAAFGARETHVKNPSTCARHGSCSRHSRLPHPGPKLKQAPCANTAQHDQHAGQTYGLACSTCGPNIRLSMLNMQAKHMAEHAQHAGQTYG